MLLHDVVVVEQPFAGRADVGAPVGRVGETQVRALEDAAGVVEPGEERGPPAGRTPGQPLPGGQVLGSLGQVLVAQQLAADRAGEQNLAGVGAGAEAAEDGAAERQRIDGEGLWNGKRATEASV
ncbi:MAG TPA: hypothetical protein VFG66_10625 [Gemmatimonadales bacterium]|nr:hypothetical protein [Gemmatimonadales bacterium]